MIRDFRVVSWSLVLCCAWMSWAPGKCSGGDDAAWQWRCEEGEALSLNGPHGIVWRLNFSKDQPKVFFDPLGTATGKSLTWNAPPDHAWHHGLWFSWKAINEVNYWEFGADGKPAGTTELRDRRVTFPAEGVVSVELDFLYHPANENAAVMKEAVRITVETPREDGSYRIDWQQRTTALVDVRLDRTPPPGRPGGVAHGGYGGLSYRGAQTLQKVVVTDSERRKNMETHRQTARWLDATGEVDGQSVGVTMFDHPRNPRHPTPWFIVHDQQPHGPFWYTNPALLCWEPYDLRQGESLELKYRVLVHEGTLGHTALDAEWKAFAKP